MKIFHGIRSWICPKKKRVVVGLGFFDGVHIGHKKVIKNVVETAKKINGISLILTFDIHPKNLFNKKIDLISTYDERIELFRKNKIDNVLFLYFSYEVANMSPEIFYKHYLVDILNVKAVVVGFNFHFGRSREGSTDFLKLLGKKYNCITKIVPQIIKKKQVVSSTRIRKLLFVGNVEEASQCLGRYYSVCGVVIKGDGIGTRYGVPTANLSIWHEKVIPRGVFVGTVEVKGKKFYALINGGTRPSIVNKIHKLIIEVHIIGFNKVIYGETIKVYFVKKVREEMKFKTVDTLFEQIKKDRLRAFKS